MRFECSRKATSVVELADVVVEIAYSGVSRAPIEFSNRRCTRTAPIAESSGELLKRRATGDAASTTSVIVCLALGRGYLYRFQSQQSLPCNRLVDGTAQVWMPRVAEPRLR